MTNILAVGAPAVIAASCCPIGQGWTPPPVGHRHWSGGSLLYVDAYLDLLLCCGTGLCSLIVVGLCLLKMWWSSSCRGSSLPRRGSCIAGKVPSLRGRMDWQPLSTPLEWCAWNMTPVASEPRLSSRTSSPSCASLAPSLDSSPTSARCCRNARSFFACQRQT
jgi:hypothetical protein